MTIVSSGYYAAATPLERRAVGAAALDRGRPQPWKVLTELLRTAIVASAFAWIADRGGDLHASHGRLPPLILWTALPPVRLTSSLTARGHGAAKPPVEAAIRPHPGEPRGDPVTVHLSQRVPHRAARSTR